MKKFLALLFVTALGLVVAVSPALAERLESDSYVIQFGNFNITAGEKESSTYKVTDTVGQTGAGPYGEYGVSNYFVGGGFQYIYQIQDFSFVISKLLIDFGQLNVGLHNTDSHTLTITTRGGDGYKIYAYEEHELQHTTEPATYIPNTTCDAGTCTHIAAGLWTNTTVDGFGFNMSGDDIPADFVSANHFRSFADRANSEEMQVVMENTNSVREAQSTVTYKAGLSGNQAAGDYTTAIVFVAVPGY